MPTPTLLTSLPSFGLFSNSFYLLESSDPRASDLGSLNRVKLCFLSRLITSPSCIFFSLKGKAINVHAGFRLSQPLFSHVMPYQNTVDLYVLFGLLIKTHAHAHAHTHARARTHTHRYVHTVGLLSELWPAEWDAQNHFFQTMAKSFG